MKIAICLSGIPKYWEKSLNSILRYLPTADVFIHMWKINSEDEINSNTAYSHDAYHNIVDIRCEDVIFSYNTKKYKLQNFSTKLNDFVNERKKYHETIDDIQGSESIAQLSMFYSMREACRLKSEYERDNGFLYDLVFRFRFDSEIVKFIDLNNVVIEDYLYIPEGRDWGGINDQFSFGGSKVMDMVCECYTFYESILKQTKFYGPEAVLKQHLDSFLDNSLIKRNEVEVKINNEK
jgi:hypothetical protein